MTVRIAMWSGPRNISTAMMRSWENRADCQVVDEPFYAYYLNKTQIKHPMFDEVLASQSCNYDEVAADMSIAPIPSQLQYQKHMTQHMLKDEDLTWAKSLKHCFLIRDPAYVVQSYTKSRGECSVEDIGIIRQLELYQYFTDLTGQKIPVIDSYETLLKPKQVLSKLCKALGIDFDENMLKWPKGERDSDGVWASHWYHSVNDSTGFSVAKHTELQLNAAQQRVVDAVMPHYLELKKHII